MSDFSGSHGGGFEDLVPWADPYIAALIEKLKQESDAELADNDMTDKDEMAEVVEPFAELPPPLDSEDEADDAWQADWSSENWPRR